jgi:glycosyltransferase involved in cell wall biosynthesis
MLSDKFKISVTWIPEHNSAASFSMRRYWLGMAAECLTSDRYNPHSVIELRNQPRVGGVKGRIERALHRNLVYPLQIRQRFSGSIAHCLDHSWADMLNYVPRKARRVVTVHDLIPLRFPGELTPSQQHRFRKRIEILNHVDAIIAVSKYTKSEIVNNFNVHPDQIHVVYNGVEQNNLIKRRETRNLNNNFTIGSIGSTLERKNLQSLPAALDALKGNTNKRITLIRAGEMLPDDLASSIRSVLGKEGLVELGILKDSELKHFYNRLNVIAFPSLYEGFGLPVLEAMAAGVPVVSSSATSLPEVGGENVLYFDPTDSEAFATQLAKVANDELPADWNEKAWQRTKSFTWRNTLEKVYNVYDNIS